MPQEYFRVGVVPIDQVIPIILDHQSSKKAKFEFLGTKVGVVSLRLRTFAIKGCTCSRCGLKATHFAVERGARTPDDSPCHLNLWGMKDGEEVLFTHDHTLDRSAGGADNLSNTTTMCSPCNGEKAEIDRAARAALGM